MVFSLLFFIVFNFLGLFVIDFLYVLLARNLVKNKEKSENKMKKIVTCALKRNHERRIGRSQRRIYYGVLCHGDKCL